MRVLVVSHGITASGGFGNQTYLLSRALSDAGHELFCVHNSYRGEPIFFDKACTPGGKKLDGLTILPWGGSQWGEDVVPYYLERYDIDVVLTLGDIYCYQYIAQLPLGKCRWVAHYVLDTENLVASWNASFANPSAIILPTKRSAKLASSVATKPVIYMPHGVDPQVFRPCSPDEKVTFRAHMGLPKDSFVIGCVAHNQARKKLDRLMLAFAAFAHKNPAAVLLMHCSPKESIGWDLRQIALDNGILNRVYFTDKASKNIGDNHTPPEEMRQLYCCMDVHALPTGGEGFGVPIVEAMMCGIPNVATAYTSIPEFLGDHRGFPIPVDCVELHHTGGAWASVNVPLMAEAFEFIQASPDKVALMINKARAFAVKEYSSETVAAHWVKLFENIPEVSKPVASFGLKAVRASG